MEATLLWHDGARYELARSLKLELANFDAEKVGKRRN